MNRPMSTLARQVAHEKAYKLPIGHVSKCGEIGCKTCDNLIEGGTIQIRTGKNNTAEIKISDKMTCSSTKVIYLIECGCHKIYIGETEKTLRKHMKDLRLRHLTLIGQHLHENTCGGFRVVPIKRVASQKDRKREESRLIEAYNPQLNDQTEATSGERSFSPRVSRCGNEGCTTCDRMIEGETIKIRSIEKDNHGNAVTDASGCEVLTEAEIRVTEDLNCCSQSLIYVLKCGCGKIYIGGTPKTIRDHLKGKVFTRPPHSFVGKHLLKNSCGGYGVMPIQRIVSMGERKAEERRLIELHNPELNAKPVPENPRPQGHLRRRREFDFSF